MFEEVLSLLAFPFFQRALLLGIILGALMALLGVFVVLRNMSFFSDAIGHSALAGIALGVLLNIDPFIAGFAFTLLVAVSISGIRSISVLSIDTLLGIFFPSSVALGVILVSMTPGYQADLVSYLFGNILTVTSIDVVISIALTIAISIILLFTGKGFIAISLDPQLAKAEGIPVSRYELLLLIILAAVIALAIKFVGIILVTALLVIPAASAQNMANSLASMFAISIVVNLLSVIAGMAISAAFAIPSGPAIVLVGACIFAFSLLLQKVR